MAITQLQLNCLHRWRNRSCLLLVFGRSPLFFLKTNVPVQINSNSQLTETFKPRWVKSFGVINFNPFETMLLFAFCRQLRSGLLSSNKTPLCLSSLFLKANQSVS
ncbi:hypothetical protein CRM22_009854 [Opisthorchis felineus]|uniref:Uncharacterized protein n=1 Tax=Opisthorchis felineus TaxID=147828 RepID=A0A4S2L6C6_OPIFE|nr:hypothetical protein CRM22_009854 [Opisthorchis felineus]